VSQCRLESVSERLRALGVVNVGLTLSPDVKAHPASEVAHSVADFFECCLEGRGVPFDLNDRPAVA
jgi:hypothetical protein